nr:LamG-like jellyroll fold domain-containing protein [Modestobacter muralis]
MAPRVQPGDVTVARPVDTADLAAGQVLLVDDPDGAGGLLLHRLVTVEDGGLRLRGDANPTADGALVDPAAVHGVATLRLPGLGLPVVWAAQQRWAPLGAATLALAGLLGLAVLHRPPADQRPGRGPRRGRRRSAAVLAVAVLLPGAAVAAYGTAAAAYTASTANGPDAFGSALYYTCASGSAGAAQYLDLQESSGTVATNRGSYAGNGTYAGGVTYGVAGPPCTGATRAVRLDGSSGFVHSGVNVSLPPGQAFSTQLWFSTTTTRGGYLIGFGNGTNGATSSAKDRMVYMTTTGRIRFGVYDTTPRTVVSPASYNDGKWHLVTATFSTDTGIRLFVDGALVQSDATVTAAENNTGYFRAGYDSLQGWPDEPTSHWFAGSIAHMSVFAGRLTRAEVAAQFAAAG